MYYRRKILLGILEEFGSLTHTKLQKVLFLITRKQEKKAFDFVPYRYGSFSFQANQDMKTMCKMGMAEEKNESKSYEWISVGDAQYFAQLNKTDQEAIIKTKQEIDGLSQKELVRFTYLKYPYYAIKSQIASELLSHSELENVNAQKRTFENEAFFTIGYEGISLETYLNKLIINDVRLLCDVRKNPLSMKYGFSKNQLKNACQSIGITYKHIPQLGIESDKRTELHTIDDYNKLFDEYDRTTLVENKDNLLEVVNLTKEYKRVAITCFEKEPCMCHRSRVAKGLLALPDWDIAQKNL